jgi:hypothetical protein
MYDYSKGYPEFTGKMNYVHYNLVGFSHLDANADEAILPWELHAIAGTLAVVPIPHAKVATAAIEGFQILSLVHNTVVFDYSISVGTIDIQKGYYENPYVQGSCYYGYSPAYNLTITSPFYFSSFSCR